MTQLQEYIEKQMTFSLTPLEIIQIAYVVMEMNRIVQTQSLSYEQRNYFHAISCAETVRSLLKSIDPLFLDKHEEIRLCFLGETTNQK
jgi:hypothetical protein